MKQGVLAYDQRTEPMDVRFGLEDYYGGLHCSIFFEEQFDPDRTILSLEFKKKQAKKTSEEKQAKKTSRDNKRRKTRENMDRIREYLHEHGESKPSDIAKYLSLSPARTRAILSDMDDIEAMGGTTNRAYRIIEN